jgi:imidazole glycerol-phosphate synthase subunit HisH
MSGLPKAKAAIIDYGLGNLFSVSLACSHAGLEVMVTDQPKEVVSADVVILPGVGAFADAMDGLRKRDLIAPLCDRAAANRLLVGVCLGQQLLMTESYEFGHHQGLGLIPGDVVRLEGRTGSETELAVKIPQVGWNRIRPVDGDATSWNGTPLQGLNPGVAMYFVHSYYVRPTDPEVILAKTEYGHNHFCAALRSGNLFAFQFHPERSGPEGMRIYHSIAAMARSMMVI